MSHDYQSNEILKLISRRESATLEFKSSVRWDYRQNKLNKELEKVIVKTIAGFFNVTGGKLLIGIDDEGAVLGLKNDYQTLKKKDSDGFELLITQLISTYIGKEFCLYIHTSFHDVNGEDICLVDVEASPKPAYIHEGNDVRFFIRTGGSTQLLNAKEVTEYVSSRWSN
jgi:predicted HTH transcriptional regulator